MMVISADDQSSPDITANRHTSTDEFILTKPADPNLFFAIFVSFEKRFLLFYLHYIDFSDRTTWAEEFISARIHGIWFP
jgi:hypothetical protein